MHKKLSLLALLSIIFAVKAQIHTINTHQNVIIKTDPSKGFTEYPMWGKFPAAGKTYRKVIATLTFECATGLNCGEWDYLNHIYIGKRRGANNDSLYYEIMRLVTPYGNYWKNGSGWKHGWKFDITDFAPLLQDSIEIIYRHSGYEANNDRGWKINLTFEMTEGTPMRNVLGITRLVQKSMNYTSNQTFADAYAGSYLKLHPSTKISTVHILQTGHGAVQPDNCGEFCNKTRYITLNGTPIDQAQVWRNDCGENALYPQAGTWLYDRANWCPGEIVRPYEFNYSYSHTDSQFLDFEMQSYQANGNGSNYSFTAYIIDKDSLNFNTDAEVVDILSPSTWFQYKRMNPSCGLALVKIKNYGKNKITNLEINYGFNGNTNWWQYVEVEINSGETAIIELPMGAVPSTSSSFDVKITKVNQQVDEYEANNSMSTTLNNAIPQLMENKLIIHFKTNNAPTENAYRFKDAAGHTIYEKNNFTNPNTIYKDTFTFYNGCFQLEFDDKGPAPANNPLNEDGLGWWANPADGNGYIQLRKGSNGFLAKNFEIDFGTQFNYWFTTGYTLNATTPDENAFNVYPNPAANELIVDLPAQSEHIYITDMNGKVVYETACKANELSMILPTDMLANGNYTCKVIASGAVVTKRFVLLK